MNGMVLSRVSELEKPYGVLGREKFGEDMVTTHNSKPRDFE